MTPDGKYPLYLTPEELTAIADCLIVMSGQATFPQERDELRTLAHYVIDEMHNAEAITNSRMSMA